MRYAENWSRSAGGSPRSFNLPKIFVDQKRIKNESDVMPSEMSPATARNATPQPSRLQALLRQLNLKADLRDSLKTRSNGPNSRHPTGLCEIDELIGGGFPSGCLSEISGPISSGRTTLVFALLAQATRSGARVAWVDRADTFDPPSAEAAGVVLEHVLWVRAQRALAALRCSERILETEGFALVVLDLTGHDLTGHGRRNDRGSIPQAVWLRLTRLTAGKQNALVLLSDQRLAGSRAALALEMQPAIPHFTGTPALLETLETHALLTRQRSDLHADYIHGKRDEEQHEEQPPQTVTRGHEIKLRSRTAPRAA